MGKPRVIDFSSAVKQMAVGLCEERSTGGEVPPKIEAIK